VPAVSVKQKRFAGIALAMKKGKVKKSYSPEAAKAAETMTKKELRHFARTKEKDLPQRKRKK